MSTQASLAPESKDKSTGFRRVPLAKQLLVISQAMGDRVAG